MCLTEKAVYNMSALETIPIIPMDVVRELDLALPVILAVNLSQWPLVVLQLKKSLVTQKELFLLATVIKDGSVKVLTGHLKLQTRSVIILYYGL